MIKTFSILACAVLACCVAAAQSFPTIMGSRAMGIGNATTCLGDEWSLFNNIGGLALLENITAAASYHAHPSFAPFNRMSFVFATPVGPGTAAAGIYRFGDDLYSEQVCSIGFSNSLGLASLGAKVNLIQYHAAGYGNAMLVTASFGGLARLTDQISIGAYITNINQPGLTRNSDEAVPTILCAGLSARLSEKFLATTEVEKDLSLPLIWKSGLEYRLNRKFAARTGFNLYPRSAHAGFEFSGARLTLSYAACYKMNLGDSHQATLSWSIKKRK